MQLVSTKHYQNISESDSNTTPSAQDFIIMTHFPYPTNLAKSWTKSINQSPNIMAWRSSLTQFWLTKLPNFTVNNILIYSLGLVASIVLNPTKFYIFFLALLVLPSSLVMIWWSCVLFCTFTPLNDNHTPFPPLLKLPLCAHLAIHPYPQAMVPTTIAPLPSYVPIYACCIKIYRPWLWWAQVLKYSEHCSWNS